jgi:hypothetical protein
LQRQYHPRSEEWRLLYAWSVRRHNAALSIGKHARQHGGRSTGAAASLIRISQQCGGECRTWLLPDLEQRTVRLGAATRS